MIEPTWDRTEVPPLRADFDRLDRERRKDLARIARVGWLMLAALMGLAAGALIALTTSGGLG